MGLIRKTASIATLGVIPFRSKREKLRRAESGRKKAEVDLERQRVARAEADERVSEAEKRVREAELSSLHAAKKAAEVKGRRGRRRAKEARSVLERLGEIVESAQPAVEEQAREAGRRGRAAAEQAGEMGRRAAKRARKEAAKAADRARKEAAEGRKRAAKGRQAAKAKVKDLEADLGPRVEAAVKRGRAKGQEAVDQVREKVGSAG